MMYVNMVGFKARVSNAKQSKLQVQNHKPHQKPHQRPKPNYAVMDVLRNGASFAGRKCAFIKSSTAAVKNAEEKTYVNIIV